MVEILSEIPATAPNPGSDMIGLDREREHRLGEIHQTLFKDLVSFPSGIDGTLDDKNHILMVHEGLGGETVASIQHNEGFRVAGGTTIFLHHALSMIVGPDGILRGEKHFYKAVTRSDMGAPVQRVDLLETVKTLDSDDILMLKRFVIIAKEQLRNRPK